MPKGAMPRRRCLQNDLLSVIAGRLPGGLILKSWRTPPVLVDCGCFGQDRIASSRYRHAFCEEGGLDDASQAKAVAEAEALNEAGSCAGTKAVV
jgi:hypothetical protein